ncbi:MAG TPA: hypothetical protein VM144_08330 [Aestuariivirga sp.]|nr:hypothetical protein [Aestuariivirga sp.]
MRTLITFTLAALMLATASGASIAHDSKKKTVQTQVTTANQQVSIKHLRLRMRATILVVNQ